MSLCFINQVKTLLKHSVGRVKPKAPYDHTEEIPEPEQAVVHSSWER